MSAFTLQKSPRSALSSVKMKKPQAARCESTLGIDFGTSGARAVVVDVAGNINARSHVAFTDNCDAAQWQANLFNLINQIPAKLRAQIAGIAINGTSSTVLLCDRTGTPLIAPLMYNDARGVVMLDKLSAIAPANHTVLSATSSLAKLLWMTQLSQFNEAKYFLHQADWLAFLLHGKLGYSDDHNALKLGYDVENLCYPTWLTQLPVSELFPQVLTPGTPIATVTPEIATRCGFRRDCLVCAGTTDSIAAFIASGARLPGEAVTSLGSTLVLKLLSTTRVENSQHGIYSHRLGDLWLTGGASNTGGAVLRHFFTDMQIQQRSRQIDVSIPSELDYYPLLQPGDRFPINDPHLPPRMEPRPDDPVKFLHGLLTGIARIENQGYHLLQCMGATPLMHVYTAGGGAINATWAAIRARHLKVPLVSPVQTEAAYGTAILAMRGINASAQSLNQGKI